MKAEMKSIALIAIIGVVLIILMPLASAVVSNNDIASIAVSYEGQDVNLECKGFVQKVINEVAGSYILSTGYTQCYLDIGTEIQSSQVMRGDVIQISHNTDLEKFYDGMHTAIVLENYGDGSFRVVDSNYVGPKIVGIHNWNPFNFAAKSKYDLDVHFYRLGIIDSTQPKLDLIILIDTTGSMGGEINQVKVSANEIVEALDSTGFDYRVAVADYRDYPELPYGGSSDYLYNLNLPFSNNKDSIISSINGLTLGWGADWRESVYSALVMSMTDVNKDITNSDNYGWRNGVSKAIIIMGDAPPHIPEPWIGGYALSDVTYWSENIDPIVVYSIVVGYDSTTYVAFSKISEGTGGKVYSAETASEVADAIIEAIGDIGTDDHGVNVEITPAHNEVSPEDSVAYSVNITNKGNIADVYNVSFEAENILGSYRGHPMAIQSSWIVFNSAQVTFNSEMSEVRPLTITVPENWAGMEDMVYSFDVIAISTTNTSIGNTSSAELKVKANNKSMIEYSKLEIQWLAELVDGSDIDRGIKNSLLTKLTNAESKADRALVDLDNGKIKTADNMLQASRNLINAFANQVDAQYDKKIMQPDAEILKEKANQIMEDLEKAKNN